MPVADTVQAAWARPTRNRQRRIAHALPDAFTGHHPKIDDHLVRLRNRQVEGARLPRDLREGAVGAGRDVLEIELPSLPRGKNDLLLSRLHLHLEIFRRGYRLPRLYTENSGDSLDLSDIERDHRPAPERGRHIFRHLGEGVLDRNVPVADGDLVLVVGGQVRREDPSLRVGTADLLVVLVYPHPFQPPAPHPRPRTPRGIPRNRSRTSRCTGGTGCPGSRSPMTSLSVPGFPGIR